MAISRACLAVIFLGIIIGALFVVLGSPVEKRVFCDVHLHRLAAIAEGWGHPDNILEWQTLAANVATRCEKEGVVDFAANSVKLINTWERENWDDGIGAMTVRFMDPTNDSIEYGHFQVTIKRSPSVLMPAGPLG